MRKSVIALFCLCPVLTVLADDWSVKVPEAGKPVKKFELGNNKMYHKGWIDFNKNGIKDVYEDPTASVDDRVEDLLSRMTIDEKTCQMVTLYGYKRVLPDDLPTPDWSSRLWKDGIGAIDEHLNGFRHWGLPPEDNPNFWPASRHAWAMNEVQRFFVEHTRLGIPADFTNEGIRGVEAYKATNFPTQLALGHTWDRGLVYEVGRITAREARLLGYTNVYAPILDVGRDQRWGRYEEVYGESPYLVGELGVQMVLGMQKDYTVAATSKHYIAYSNNKGAREGMARVDPQASPHEVENIHVYPWREVIARAGLLGVMSAYNDYDGEPVQGSKWWLTERLREEFGFKGYVVSDSDAVEYLHSKHHVSKDMKESVRQSVMAGLNVRCTFRTPESYVYPLRELVEEGTIPMSVIDDRVRDILRVKFLVGLFDDPYQRDYAAADSEVDSPENNEVSLRASREGIVLLKNSETGSDVGVDGKTLPLDLAKIKKIAVVGPNADETSFATTHYGPLMTDVTSVLSGIKERFSGIAEVKYAKGCELVDAAWPQSEIMPFPLTADEENMMSEALRLVEDSDVAIVVVGGGQRTCGENKSRTSLDLPPIQQKLLERVKAAGKPMIVVLINGRPLSINWVEAYADAILEAWYPGAHGGTAVAEILAGDVNPSGKLTVTFPKTVGQIPFNFPYKPNSQIDGYDKPGLDGNQSRINGALYDFGYGLSYTTFEYSELRLSSEQILPEGKVDVTFNITNTGNREGDEIVQLYFHDKLSSITVYEKQLRGFERVHLAAGETKSVTMTIDASHDLSLLDRNMRRVVEPGEFDIMIGASSTDIRLSKTLIVLNPDGSSPVDEIYPDDASKKFSSLPALIRKGGDVNFPVGGARLSSVVIKWGDGTDCSFEIQTTDGGGQFLPVYSGKATIGDSECSFDSIKANEFKIVVTEGIGNILKVNY